jgi:hypothetical protein
MAKLILALMAGALVGCFMGSEDGSESGLVGYSTGESCTAAHPTCHKGLGGNFRVWVATKSKTDTAEFLIFVNKDTVNSRVGFENSRIGKALATNGAELLRAGGQCLTVYQTGKDTVVIGGTTAIVDVPIEPCLPYLLDKDLP